MLQFNDASCHRFDSGVILGQHIVYPALDYIRSRTLIDPVKHQAQGLIHKIVYFFSQMQCLAVATVGMPHLVITYVSLRRAEEEDGV